MISIISNIQDIKDIFKDYVDNFVEEFDISLIYVFGSYAKGNSRKDSDIDIAILLNGDIDVYTKLNILGALIDIFKREDIDLVILNNVNEVLKFQVIKYGKIIYMESLYTKAMLESRVMSEYMDKEYFRDTQRKYSHKRFLEIMKS
ncbi:nucleotidyltransferase domain-containing protein [Tissierella praeacuta]|uniref:type VII toxin-antitoxin system MntA family adenylyltransferase antitoxin n=1 Tax=Tissierella praeacuta TaxID=43131 RepID=UPI0033419D8D